MTERLKDFLLRCAGNTGTQRDFLEECGVRVSPGPSGTHGNAESQPDRDRTRVPERPHADREHKSPEFPGDLDVRSRVPEESATEKIVGPSSTVWTNRACRLIADLPDADLRAMLTDHYEETAATLEFDQERPRPEAEQLAFGQLMFRLLERGIDVRVVP